MSFLHLRSDQMSLYVSWVEVNTDVLNGERGSWEPGSLGRLLCPEGQLSIISMKKEWGFSGIRNILGLLEEMLRRCRKAKFVEVSNSKKTFNCHQSPYLNKLSSNETEQNWHLLFLRESMWLRKTNRTPHEQPRLSGWKALCMYSIARKSFS